MQELDSGQEGLYRKEKRLGSKHQSLYNMQKRLYSDQDSTELHSERTVCASSRARICKCLMSAEPVFVNVYGAQELIPMDRFRQPMEPGGPVRQIGL
jgi:hypothetical protein